jgi:hypothetical protein
MPTATTTVLVHSLMHKRARCIELVAFTRSSTWRATTCPAWRPIALSVHFCMTRRGADLRRLNPALSCMTRLAGRYDNNPAPNLRAPVNQKSHRHHKSV